MRRSNDSHAIRLCNGAENAIIAEMGPLTPQTPLPHAHTIPDSYLDGRDPSIARPPNASASGFLFFPFLLVPESVKVRLTIRPAQVFSAALPEREESGSLPCQPQGL
jgi:hypothetical protein